MKIKFILDDFSGDEYKYWFFCLIVYIIIVDNKFLYEVINCCMVNSNLLCGLFFVKKLLFIIKKNKEKNYIKFINIFLIFRLFMGRILLILKY